MNAKQLKKLLETADDNKDIRFVVTKWGRLSCTNEEIHNLEVKEVSEHEDEIHLELDINTFLNEMKLK